MKKAIITVIGKDSVGIIAKVCTYLARHNINILDISQTIIQGYFNMMMIVDTSNMEEMSSTEEVHSNKEKQRSFSDIADELAALGVEIGVVIKCQKEEIFEKMHRI